MQLIQLPLPRLMTLRRPPTMPRWPLPWPLAALDMATKKADAEAAACKNSPDGGR